MSINELELQRPVTFAEEAGQTDGVRDVPVVIPLFTLPAVKRRAGVTMSEVKVLPKGKNNTCMRTVVLSH